MTSKLTAHSQRPTLAARQLVEAGAQSAFMVDDFGAAKDYLALHPGIVLIGRVYTKRTYGERLADAGGNPTVAAQRFVAEQLPIYRANPPIKIFVGLNEESFGGPDDAGAINRMAGYAIFEAERARLMAGLGLRAAVGGFSTGYPEINANDFRMWNAFLPAIEAAKAHNGILHVHEYAAPTLDWWTFDSPFGRMGWLTLRYRQLYNYILKPRGLVLPLFISECGNDRAGGGSPEIPTGNWRDLAAYWAAHGHADAETYLAEQFIWYDGELQKDSYVVGAAMFNFGWASAQWVDYELSNAPRFVARMADHIRAQADDPGTGGNDVANLFSIGQKIKVWHPAGANVRQPDATSPVTGHIEPGMNGNILAGPDNPAAKEPRYKGHYANGVEGWTGQGSIVDRDKRLFPPTVNARGTVNVPPHLQLPLYTSLTPLTGYAADPHWHGVTDIMGQFNFERIQWLPETLTWYLYVTDGRSNWGGPGWIPWRFKPAGEPEIIANVSSPEPTPDWGDFPDPGSVVVTPPPAVPPVVEPPPIVVDVTGQIPDGGFERGFIDGGQNDWFPPVGWDPPWYADENVALLPRQDIPFRKPHIFVKLDSEVTDDLKKFPEGSHVLFIRGVWFPIWIRVPRRVTLAAGTYTPRMNVFPDPVAEFNPKRYGQDPITSRFRLYLSDPTDRLALIIPGFRDQDSFPPGAWREYVGLPHTVPAGEYDVILEYQGIFGMRSNGAFFDNVRLVTDGELPPPPPAGEIDVAAIRARLTALDEIAAEIGQQTEAIRGLLA